MPNSKETRDPIVRQLVLHKNFVTFGLFMANYETCDVLLLLTATLTGHLTGQAEFPENSDVAKVCVP